MNSLFSFARHKSSFIQFSRPHYLAVVVLHRRMPWRTSCRKEEADDLQQIKDSGELVVLTLYSSTSYFIYRGQDMGFQYELSEQFAKSLGVKLRIEVARNVHELIEKLQAGKGDLIAYNLPITKEWKDSLLYCGEEVITHQVIVQRNGGRTKPLKDVTELIGKDVYVKPGKYYERLVNLDEELGGGIHIHKVTNDSISAEDLITQVAQGKIPYTVADNDVAQLNTTYYPNLNIGLSISFDQRASWAVRKDCPQLAATANKWHEENMTSPAYTASMKRYFEIGKAIPHSPILSLREGKISHYDDLFKKYAPEIDWDWRLLASLAYTESNFDSTAVSWAVPGADATDACHSSCHGSSSGKEQTPKKALKLPKKITNVIHCKNPRCITSIEQELPHIFYLSDEKTETYRCQYCEEKYSDFK